MKNPTFSRIANFVRESAMPAELKNSLLLLFFRMKDDEQSSILKRLETNPETLPLFAELLTELEQNKINLNDTNEIERVLEKYLAKMA